MKDYPSQAYLEECFTYNKETGELIWRKRPLKHFKNEAIMKRANGRNAGKNAGCIWKSKYGYKCLATNIFDSNYQIHRLIWNLVYGENPNHIDHINGNGCDNRLENLRSVSIKENARNRKIGKYNKSGVVGVFWFELEKKWRAQIKVDGKSIIIGHYDNKWDAICARKSADNLYGYHINHGRR